MSELTEEQKKDVMEFQNMQQQLQFISIQRQQTAVQLAEAKNALGEVKKSEGTLYRLAGTVLVPKKKDALEKELAGEIEALEARQGIIQKQEDKIRERAPALAKKIEAIQKAAKNG
ncbi:MAG: prefoldin subunit [Candidatus Micrarchaeota archaeon]|nr:prefoldin subunit [Candidatus Micrarchaeota archaeon]